MQAFSPLVLAMSDPSTYTVGLHVRTGDAAFSSTQLSPAELYARHKFMFDFAEQLGSRQSLPYRLLLLTDSVPLRDHASGLHPSLLHPNSSVGHVAREPSALANAVVEHWIYSAADVFA